MATKTITITEEAYERLASLKENKESFSEIINKITNKHKLSDYFGILSKESANELEKNIKSLRKNNKAFRAKRIKDIIQSVN